MAVLVVAFSFRLTNASANRTRFLKQLPVGAIPVSPKDKYPYFIDWDTCGGSLVHEDIVLTAAHCDPIKDRDVYIGAFERQTVSGIAQKRQIEERIKHPKYDTDSARFDIMVLKLSRPSTLSTVSLNEDPDEPSANTRVTAMGHGQTEREAFSSILMEVDIPRVSDDICEDAYKNNDRKFTADVMLCAGIIGVGGKGICKGDSGGPLIEKRNGRDVQVGVTSWGKIRPCEQPKFPGVYVKVGSVHGWIHEQICKLSNSPPNTCSDSVSGVISLWNGVTKTTTSPPQTIEVRLQSRTLDWSKSTTTNSAGEYQIIANLVNGQEYFITMEAPRGYAFGGFDNDDVDSTGKSDPFIASKGQQSIRINARLQEKRAVKFYGQLSFASSEDLDAFKEGNSNAKVSLYRYDPSNKQRRFDRIKTRSVKQTGNVRDIGKWVLPLATIRDGKYYVKFTIGPEFRFTKDSDINKWGNTGRRSVVYGGRYKENAGITLNTNLIGPISTSGQLTDAIRINVGGPDFTDLRGTLWTGYKTSAIYSSAKPYSIANAGVINGTDLQELYRSELYFVREENTALPMKFEIPLPAGDYFVRLHFMEKWRKAQREGARIFNVRIEDSLVLKNLDIFKEAGGGYIPLVKDFEATVVGSALGDSLLTLEFENVTENPALSAVEILLEPPCVVTTVDFDTKADGTPLSPGLYVKDEWLDLGLRVSAPGEIRGLPRLFDTSNPVPKPGHGDPDLGAPNRGCSPPGPGVGPGGAPGKLGKNCDNLGNVLIIQEEKDIDFPNDSHKGGTIMFDFVGPAVAVRDLGFLDTDDGIKVNVSQMAGNNMTEMVFDLPIYGENSKQTLEINIENVKQVMVTFEQSGAVTHISFCRPNSDGHAMASVGTGPSS